MHEGNAVAWNNATAEPMCQESSGGTQAFNAAGTSAASAGASVRPYTAGPIPAEGLVTLNGTAMGAGTSGTSKGVCGATSATKSGCMPESRCSSSAAGTSDGAWRRGVVVLYA